MLKTIQNLEAVKARREEEGEAGFSLIELIIVVVILGILAAVAIPIFLNVQQDARDNALAAVAGNASSQVAASLANTPGQAPGDVSLVNLEQDGVALTATGTTIDNFCVTAVQTGAATATSGPGCP